MIFVIYYIKCKISNYVKSSIKTLPEVTEVTYLLEFNKAKLVDFCLENDISIKYLLLSIYINVIGKNVDNGLISSNVNESDILSYNDIDINSENIPIFFLPIEYNIKNIVKYVKLLEKEYELSYSILKSVKMTPLSKIINIIENNTLFGFNYNNNYNNNNNNYNNNNNNYKNYIRSNSICNLNIIIIEERIKFIFNHKLTDRIFMKILDGIKNIIPLF